MTGAPHYEDGPVAVWHGDCIEVMRSLPAASVDAVVTDPPYGLEFMGREWDGADGFRRSLNPADVGRENVFGRSSRTSPEYRAGHLFEEWTETWAAEAFRLLKPGGHLLAFGGTRTFHRLTAGIEDAGFEIRDSIAWLYGSGFPKSLDVSKAIDKQLGTEGTYGAPKSAAHAGWIERGRMRGVESEGHDGWQRPSTNDPVAVDQRARQYEGGTEQARDWQGWGTALKPAFEPVVVARKPLSGTVAQTVLAYGTGALNIDASRIAGEADRPTGLKKDGSRSQKVGHEGWDRPWKHDERADRTVGDGERSTALGRWPANVILDESQAVALDEQSGVLTSGANPTRRNADMFRDTYSPFKGQTELTPARGADSGGASRFFKVVQEDTCQTPDPANTADRTTSPQSAPDGSAPSGAATSAHHATAKPSPAPSTNGTPNASVTADESDTPTTPNTDDGFWLESPQRKPSPTRSPAPAAEHPEPIGTTRTTTSPSTSSGSAAPATSLDTSRSAAVGAPDLPLEQLGSRFQYTAKAGGDERPNVDGIAHPTVKPVDLMRWLVRLVTPKGGTILEPFAGSGTTVEAAVLEGFRCIAIEREADYLPLIMQRVSKPHAVGLDFGDWEDAS